MAPERGGRAARRGSPDGGPVTLADVAAFARVSQATATRALNGHPRVRPETRARVEAAVAALGYVPHLGARALATRSSRTIGLLIPSTSDGFWGRLAEGLEQRAAAAGFSVLLGASHSDQARERAMIDLFLGKRVDGIVVGSASGSAWMSRTPIPLPMVLVSWDADLGPDLEAAARDGAIGETLEAIARRTDTGAIAHVRTDDVDGAAQATRHLLALGHTQIAFAGLRPVRPALLRLLGVRSALAEAGLEAALVLPSPASLDGGREAGHAIVAASDRPTAVVAFDDMVAVGVIRAAHAAGLHVPGDLSVVGFDDVPVAAFVEPPLTTIAQDAAGLGRLAVEVVLGRTDPAAASSATDGAPGAKAAGIATVLPGRLVERQSTGPPPGGRRPSGLR